MAAEPALGLYVHVPFCEVKCTYCHFAIDPRRPDGDRQERYTRALLRDEVGVADTLYFGGGTPSLQYWDDAPFLGFGMAAHSYRDGIRSWNHDRYARYDFDPFVEWRDGLDRVERAGLVAVADGQLRLTDRGVLLSNEVFESFV